MDPILSLVVTLGAGWIGGTISEILKLPRIIFMIALGIVLLPYIHPSILYASTTFSNSVSPASTIRTFALLVALARGGLTMNIKGVNHLHITVLLTAVLPYTFELLTEAMLSRILIPSSVGLNSSSPILLSFLAASTWAPLSPSVVIPNMLDFHGKGLQKTAGMVLTAAPLEIAAALIAFSAFEGCLKSTVSSKGSIAEAAAYIPLQIIGSILFGFLSAFIFWIYNAHLRPKILTKLLGEREFNEVVVVFLLMYFCTFAVCSDLYIPKLVGLLSALSMALGVQLLCPELVSGLTDHLKVVWRFAESFLFVLTGFIIRQAIDSKSPALSGNFFGLLVAGSFARIVAQAFICVVWEYAARPPESRVSLRESCAVVARRCAFLWTATMPKATLQASLGPKPQLEAALLGITAATGAYIAQSAALAILYMALIGAVLTFSVGLACAKIVESLDRASEPWLLAKQISNLSVQAEALPPAEEARETIAGEGVFLMSVRPETNVMDRSVPDVRLAVE